jgi:hypothetical protein
VQTPLDPIDVHEEVPGTQTHPVHRPPLHVDPEGQVIVVLESPLGSHAET